MNMKCCDDEIGGVISIHHDQIYQAAKALVYFFAEDLNTIYTIIFFSVFRWNNDCHDDDNYFDAHLRMIMISIPSDYQL